MVVQGQTVVLVGESGWATGPHLHLNVLVNGELTDSMEVLTGE